MLSMPTFLLSSVLIYSFTSAVPVISKGYVLLPVGDLKESGGRQGIIAGWIQNSQVFPIEVNVPQIISNVTSGVQGIGQNVGQGLQTVGQNVGQGLQNWVSSLGQRFPIINRLPIIGSQTNHMTTQKLLVMMPVKKGDVNSLPDAEELFTYP